MYAGDEHLSHEQQHPELYDGEGDPLYRPVRGVRSRARGGVPALVHRPSQRVAPAKSTVPPATPRGRTEGTASTRRPVTTPDAPHQSTSTGRTTQMDQQQTTPTLAQVMGTLDELAAAARAADADRYRAAVRLAQGQQITEEQQRDAYHWGRQGAARTFDWRGE